MKSRNGELAKEILLNESAIFETENDIMNSKEDIRVKKVERKLKKLETLLEDRLEKTNIAMREAKAIGKEIKKLRTE